MNLMVKWPDEMETTARHKNIKLSIIGFKEICGSCSFYLLFMHQILLFILLAECLCLWCIFQKLDGLFADIKLMNLSFYSNLNDLSTKYHSQQVRGWIPMIYCTSLDVVVLYFVVFLSSLIFIYYTVWVGIYISAHAVHGSCDCGIWITILFSTCCCYCCSWVFVFSIIDFFAGFIQLNNTFKYKSDFSWSATHRSTIGPGQHISYDYSISAVNGKIYKG